MSYTLYIGDRLFSSWSLRGWLMLEKFGLSYQTVMVGLYSGTMAQDMKDLAPARTVPAMKTATGHILSDSISMAETLAEENPNAGLWPKDAGARALARNLVAEMHAGFGALRGECPNNIAWIWKDFEPSPAVLKDVARVEYLWEFAQSRYGRSDSPWLFGDYSLADAFYAPICCRMTTYNLPKSDRAKAYIDATLTDPAFLDWRKSSLTEVHDPFPYDFKNAKADWPY